MFDILRKEGLEYVSQEDLKSMMAGILLSHPGLECLQETPEFQDRSAPHQQRPVCIGAFLRGAFLQAHRGHHTFAVRSDGQNWGPVSAGPVHAQMMGEGGRATSCVQEVRVCRGMQVC